MSSGQISVAHKFPPRENARIYKDECIFCYQTPEHDDGIYLDLVSHYGYCGEHLQQFLTKNGVGGGGKPMGFLHFERKRKRTKKTAVTNEPETKITKLAIGVDGGLQEAQYEFEDSYKLVIFPGAVSYQLSELTDNQLRSCIDALIVSESANRLNELESLAGSWDGSFLIPTKHVELKQLTPAPKIPANGWRCEFPDCDKTDNLWLNLTDGKILCGRKFHDGSGGNNHAIEHYQKSRYPLAVKLGTITATAADVYSYDEDEMVYDPKLEEHLAHFGINMKAMEKTEKTMLELELDLNQKFEFSYIQESGKDLKPIHGPGFTGLINLGSSCYMNSAVQALTLIPEIQKTFSGQEALNLYDSFLSGAGRNPDENMKLQITKLFDGLLSGKFSKDDPNGEEKSDYVKPGNVVRPLSFRTLIGKGHPEFSTRKQQDVEEYLRYFFDKLEKPEINGRSIVDSFRFEILEQLRCEATGRVASSRRPEVILSLPVPMEKATNLDAYRANQLKREQEKSAGKKSEEVIFAKIPLKACLEAFAAPSIIENARSPFDENIRTNLSKTQRFSTFPDYLIVQVKKFTVADDWTPKKLEVEIGIEENLDLENLHAPPSADASDETEPMDTTTSSKSRPISAEEEAAVSQLTDAGFPMNACIKAWRQSNGDVGVAFEWLLAHVGDPDFNELPQENRSPAAKKSIDPNEEKFGEITAMGFTVNQARKSLRLANGNVEMAIGWLLDNPTDPGEEPQAGAVGGGGSGGGASKQNYRNGPGKYRLIGFISHIGSSTHSGHYVCHLLKKVGDSERWVIFNDEKVALSEEPPKAFGYVYLYERVK